jgi:hypothetical protein
VYGLRYTHQRAGDWQDLLDRYEPLGGEVKWPI